MNTRFATHRPERSHRRAGRTPTAGLVAEAVVAGYIRDISGRGPASSHARVRDARPALRRLNREPRPQAEGLRAAA